MNFFDVLYVAAFILLMAYYLGLLYFLLCQRDNWKARNARFAEVDVQHSHHLMRHSITLNILLTGQAAFLLVVLFSMTVKR